MAEELDNYAALVKQIKKEIQSARIKVSLTINEQLLIMNWKLGKAILDQQEREGWGTKVIDRLSEDLKFAFPGMKGLSARNLKYMRAFAEAFPGFFQVEYKENLYGVFGLQAAKNHKLTHEGSIVQGPLHKYKKGGDNDQQPEEDLMVRQAVAQLPWFHICTILDKAKTKEHKAILPKS